MGGRRFDGGELLVHLALVSAILGVVLMVLRLAAPAVMFLAGAAALYLLARRRSSPVEPRVLPTPPLPPLPPLPPSPPLRPREGEVSGEVPHETRSEMTEVPRLPPTPSRPARPAFGPAQRRVLVVTGVRHQPALERVRRLRPAKRAWATLVSDETHPSAPFAVAVFVGDEYVGDLADDDLLDYGPALADLARRGVDVQGPARISTRGVDVSLPDPDGLAPLNELPRGVVVPHGHPVAVADIDDDGARLLAAYPGSGWVAVTLRPPRPLHRRDTVVGVEVDLDGTRVGRLSPADAADVLPLVRFCVDRGLTVVAAAQVRRSSLHAHLEVHCVRAHDVDEQWLRDLRDPG